MPDASTVDIRVTDAAAAQIAKIAAAEGKRYLRVGVKGGGCSGFSYIFELEEERSEGDLAVGPEGGQALIDHVSLPFLTGSEIDFVDNLIGAAFQVKNPNATAACGCGVSFSI